MTDREPFEARLAAAIGRYTADDPIELDPSGMAHTIATRARIAAQRPRWGMTPGHRRAAPDGRAWVPLRLAAVLVLLALLASALLLVVGSSPRPTSWTPVPALEGDEVAPGVVHLQVDAAGRDLQSVAQGVLHREIAFAPDGGVWTVTSDGLIRLGDAAVHPIPGFAAVDLTAAPDGTLWAVVGGRVASFRDGTWSTVSERMASAVEVMPDGQVWAAGELARLEGDAWVPLELPPGVMAVSGLTSTLDGSIWVPGTRDRMWRHDGSSWTSIEPPPGFRMNLWAAGGDGVVWAYEDHGPGCGYELKHRVARYADGSWTVFDEAPGISVGGCYVGFMAVAPDGRLWASGDDQVMVFDGTTWRVALNGGGETPLRIAPDGSVWLWGTAGLLVFDAGIGR